MSDGIVKTELGLEVPLKPGQGYRRHTAQYWKEHDSVSYEMCVEMVRSGILNVSELKRLVDENRLERGLKEGVSRNSIDALLISDEFTATALQEIKRKRSLIVSAQGVEKTSELIDKAKDAKDVGGVAMATKLMHDIAQVMSDRPTSIVEERQVLRVEDFNAELDELNRRALAEPGPVYEAEIIQPVEIDAVTNDVLSHEGSALDAAASTTTTLP